MKLARKAMTEEEKAAFKARMEAARKKKEAEEKEAAKEAEKEDAKDSEIAALKSMVAQLQKALENQKPQIIQMVQDSEKVVMRWQAEVADDNVAVFGSNGMYGQVTGKTGTVIVPKSEWSRFYDETAKRHLDRRWLIVLSGLDDDERIRYGCNYTDGEILDPKYLINGIEGMGKDILEIFPKLCTSHQEVVGRRFFEAWQAGEEFAQDRELVLKLNELSKERYKNEKDGDPRKKGVFWPVISAMNAKDEQ